jgi:Domain of unknown function (DUF4282)
MNEYLTFDKFITPIIIQILFWLGLAGIVIMALFLIVSGVPGGGLMGILYLLLGPIFWRVYMEIILVLFKIHEELRMIRRQGESRL